MPRATAHLSLVLSSILFGAMAVAARLASGHMANGQLVLLRFAVGLAVVGGWALASPGSLRPVRGRLLVLRGLLGGCAAFLYFEAIGRVGAGTATLLNFTSPIWSALFATAFLGERTTPRLWIGLGLALAGMLLVVGAAHVGLSLGVAAGLASALVGGGAVTSVRALRATDNALTIFGAFCLFGALIAAPAAAAGWRPLAAIGWGWALGTGLLGVAAQLIFTHVLGHVPAAEAAVVTQLTPVTSVVLAALLVGEPITARAAAGSLLVVAGVALAAAKGVVPEAAPPPEG